jgi:hypothetical protein
MLKKSTQFIVLFLLVAFSAKLSAQNWKNEISSNYFYIKVADSDKYLDLPGSHPATAQKNIQFQIWSKDDDTFERTFIFPSINGTEFFAIRNKAGYIMDVGGKDKLSVKEKLQAKTGKKFKMKKDDGAEVQTWNYDSKGVQKWQQWKIIVVDKNRVILENVFTEKALCVDGNIDRGGNKIVSSKRSNRKDQFFVLEYSDGPNKGKLLEFD